MNEFKKDINDLKWTENPTPHYGERPGKVNGIVFHSASGIILGRSASEFMEENRFSYHGLVHPDGLVEKTCKRSKRAWHAGVSKWKGQKNINDTFIGFCLLLEGEHIHQDFFDRITQPEAFTDSHYHSLSLISVQAMIDYPGITYDNLVRHSDVSGPDVRPTNPKLDPGSGFDFNRLINRIKYYYKVATKGV